MTQIQLKGGATRHCLLIWKYAIKIPRLNYGFKLFLCGLLSNMQEVEFAKIKDDRLCPVLFKAPFGLCVVMPRCKPISKQEFWEIERHINIHSFYTIPVENKIDSFGWLNNKIVAVDYGS